MTVIPFVLLTLPEFEVAPAVEMLTVCPTIVPVFANVPLPFTLNAVAAESAPALVIDAPVSAIAPLLTTVPLFCSEIVPPRESVPVPASAIVPPAPLMNVVGASVRFVAFVPIVPLPLLSVPDTAICVAPVPDCRIDPPAFVSEPAAMFNRSALTVPFVLSNVVPERFAVVAAAIVPLSVGGDHSISLPILRAVAAGRPVGMVHIDAHCDTGDDYMGSRLHHGAPFRRAVDEGLLDAHRVIQIGIRGSTNDPDLWGFSLSSGMRVLSMDEFDDKGWRYAAEEARRIVGEGPTYLSFDIDSLDPSHAPGTGTPEAGGITVLQALRLLRELRGIDFVGGDLVEVSPPFDVGSLTAFNGASVLFEILCLLSEALVARHGIQ